MAFYGNVASGNAVPSSAPSGVNYAPITNPSIPGGDLPSLLTDYFLNFASPPTGYQAGLNQKGLAGQDPFSQYAQGQYNTAYQDWLLASAQNPGLGFTTFLKQSAPSNQALSDQYLNYGNPSAGFYKYLAQQGITDPTQPSYGYAKSQYANSYNQYQVANASNPGLGYLDYLNADAPDYNAQYRNLSPEQRGISTNVVTPRATWTM